MPWKKSMKSLSEYLRYPLLTLITYKEKLSTKSYPRKIINENWKIIFNNLCLKILFLSIYTLMALKIKTTGTGTAFFFQNI